MDNFIPELSWINVNSTNFVTEQILLLFFGYVSLSKNEGESFAVSFSLCFLLRESHPDCDFEGGWREWMLLSHFPSNNAPNTRKISNVGCKPVCV